MSDRTIPGEPLVITPMPIERAARNFGAKNFGDDVRSALGDVQLRGALRRATTLFAERRRGAIATLPAWESARDRARATKDEVLLHLDRYLEQFESSAERAGAKVHWAKDGAAACDIIGRISAERGARLVVKSKSMASEEIHLNAALAERGIEVVETDLGEYIIQLAGETPSHIVVPAIHKTRADIGALFAQKLGLELTTDVATLTAAARQVLRRRFADADIGVSGVNFAVAETGTILILENEGNARLTTTLPRVHIALMGIEKVIPRFADLEVFLQLLPRSGTGQLLTAYQSLITGTKRVAGDEGPEELHIVIFDHGRSRMLDHSVTRQALACIRCGACLNACPVYEHIGGHAYGSVYPGPIGAVITPQLFGLNSAPELPYASSLCGACREVCPVKIDIPAILLHLRSEVVEKRAGRARPLERLTFRMFVMVMTRPRLFRQLVGMLRAFQRLAGTTERVGRANVVLRRVVPPLGAWTSWRDLRPLAPRSFHELWRAELAGDGNAADESVTPRRAVKP